MHSQTANSYGTDDVGIQTKFNQSEGYFVMATFLSGEGDIYQVMLSYYT